jgi:ribonuclease D
MGFDLPEQIVTEAEQLEACCAHLAACREFGFDTEFVGEETYHPRLCLIQVATADRLILIDPLSVGPLERFWALVTDPANRVIVHAGREEVRLCRLWTGHTPGNLFDLQIAAGLVGLPYPLGHAALVHQLLGVVLAKGETRTEWRDRPLSARQIRYAYDDVRYLLPLHRCLADRLAERERAGWATEEFARLAAHAAPAEPVVEKWRKLRGVGSLDRRGLAILRELCRWREATAERTNRPARTILRDDLLSEIARRRPQRERDVQVIRGVPRRDLTAIVETVRQALELPLEACPPLVGREQDPPQVPLLAGVLGAVLGDYCARHDLAANLVASGQDVKALVRARVQGVAPPPECLLTQGWRAQHILPELQAVLEGRRNIRIADVRSESPFSVTENGVACAVETTL